MKRTPQRQHHGSARTAAVVLFGKGLLQHMQANGLKLVVASSAKAGELEHLLRLCGADQLIGAKTSSDDAERSKPDPDIVEAALREIALPAAQVVMLGDTPHDIEAASHVDVPVIALRCGGWGDAELEGALAIYDDPADLSKHDDSSPPGQGAEFLGGRRVNRV